MSRQNYPKVTLLNGVRRNAKIDTQPIENNGSCMTTIRRVGNHSLIVALLLAVSISCSNEGPDASKPNDDTIQAPPVTEPVQPESPTPGVAPEPENSNFSLIETDQSYVVREGAESISIPLQVTRNNNHSAAITVTAEPGDGAAGKNLVYSLVDATLAAGQNQAQLKISLSIDVAPILAHTRTMTVSASDGQRSKQYGRIQ